MLRKDPDAEDPIPSNDRRRLKKTSQFPLTKIVIREWRDKRRSKKKTNDETEKEAEKDDEEVDSDPGEKREKGQVPSSTPEVEEGLTEYEGFRFNPKYALVDKSPDDLWTFTNEESKNLKVAPSEDLRHTSWGDW